MNGKRHSTEPLTLKENMLWNSAGSLVYFGCQWLLTVAVVRIAGNYDAAGTLALAMAVYNIVSPISVYRMYTYQISDVEHENTLGEYLTLRFITASFAVIIAVVYTLLTCPTTAFAPIVLYLFYKLSSQFIDPLHATMQLNSRMDYIGISCSLQGVGSLFIFCISFYFSRSLELALILMILLVVLIGVAYDRPRAKEFEPITLGISKQKTRYLLTYCLPIVIAAIVCAASPSIPRQYLAISQGEAILGIYASVAAPAAIIQMGAGYVYTPLLSTFASHYSSKKLGSFKKLLINALLGIAAVGLVSGVLLVVLGEWIIVFLFGPEIASYSYLIFPVIGSTIISAYLWFLNDLLIALRQFRGACIGNAGAFIITLATTVSLVDSFGPNGISFTVIIAFTIGALILAIYLHKSIAQR